VERVIVVEVLDRRGQVAHRVRAEAFPFRIGRSYAGDLVLDDPHVEPHHATLEADADGRVVWRESAAGGAVREIAAGGELAVLLGQTRLRLRDRDFAVAPAAPLVRREGLRGWLGSHWTAVPVLLLAVAALEIAQLVANTWGKLEPAELARQEVFATGFIVLWAGAWAFATRVLIHHARFVAHVTVTCAWALARILAGELYQWAQFLVPNIEPLQTSERLVQAALGALLIFAQLSIAGVARRRSRAWIAAAIGLAGFAVTALLERNAAESFVRVIPFWSRIEPIDARWLPAESAGAFFEEAVADLGPALDREAREKEAAEPGSER
jgi:hypothetical protein